MQRERQNNAGANYHRAYDQPMGKLRHRVSALIGAGRQGGGKDGGAPAMRQLAWGDTRQSASNERRISPNRTLSLVLAAVLLLLRAKSALARTSKDMLRH